MKNELKLTVFNKTAKYHKQRDPEKGLNLRHSAADSYMVMMLPFTRVWFSFLQFILLALELHILKVQ